MPLTLEDLALSGIGSITDAILELKDYDNLWETIKVDFGAIGQNFVLRILLKTCVIDRQEEPSDNDYDRSPRRSGYEKIGDRRNARSQGAGRAVNDHNTFMRRNR